MRIIKRQNAATNTVTIDGAEFDLSALSGYQRSLVAQWVTDAWCKANGHAPIHNIDPTTIGQ